MWAVVGLVAMLLEEQPSRPPADEEGRREWPRAGVLGRVGSWIEPDIRGRLTAARTRRAARPISRSVHLTYDDFAEWVPPSMNRRPPGTSARLSRLI